MAEATISMDVRTVDAHVSVIDIIGSLTRSAEQAITEAFRSASGQRTRVIVLNFERMDYMNSSGIGLLVTTLVRANRQDQKIFAYGLSEHYRDIFELTRLNEAIHIYPDEATALREAHAV